jgi:acyl-coenzyme A thioesterase PaaI-like protein
MDPSLQEQYAPRNACFGCGPANPDGLRIRSVPSPDEPGVVTCAWQPQPVYEAFAGVLNGGIVGALLDCHMNWTAIWHLIGRDHLQAAPATVTAELSVSFRRPTPTSAPVKLTARPVSSEGDRVIVEGTLEAGGRVCATGRGTFVAVKPGHPAYYRW